MTAEALDPSAVDAFIARWANADGTERANYQLFALDLCELLAVAKPNPASTADGGNAYVFERNVTASFADGSRAARFIDLYKRGCFVLEAKQSGKKLNSAGQTRTLEQAWVQAEQYARSLPAEEGRPPFIIVVDVGRTIDLYAEFSRSGATYTAFPDANSNRITLADLHKPEVQYRLCRLWTDPTSLDPANYSAKVTRKISDKLAELAKSLEQSGQPAEAVAGFLSRCLFTMFAEDVELLPPNSFRDLLLRRASEPDKAMNQTRALWRDMATGTDYSAAIEARVLRFNGGLFENADVLPLDKAQLAMLIDAAKADWRHVEPAIFGTLLERALSPGERHKLGAHYTPRAYVERLVLPTVIEPLRDEWKDVQAAAKLKAKGKGAKARNEAVALLKSFQHRLCTIRVLDPACGSGNFLYVTLDHMKRLEAEVLAELDKLGQATLEAEGLTVSPHQLLGIEVNPRAARIAELVLWIGYLQWHYRTFKHLNLPEPVLRDFQNIENRDAVLAYDEVVKVLDSDGQPMTSWDGRTFKASPVTGEQVPDESAQAPLLRYLNPRKAKWPDADFIVGNPPFIGNKRMRLALGDGYVEALRAAWGDVPDTSDFVMYWWSHAASLARNNRVRRFGLITTNSIGQTFNRQVLDSALTPSGCRNSRDAGRSGPSCPD
ncbi:DNA methyltransferase [Luteimonas sp. A534]